MSRVRIVFNFYEFALMNGFGDLAKLMEESQCSTISTRGGEVSNRKSNLLEGANVLFTLMMGRWRWC